MKKRIALIGPGRLGQSVARLFHEAGHDIVAVISRDFVRAKRAARFIGVPKAAAADYAVLKNAELVLLALPDDHIGEVAASLREGDFLPKGAVLIHFSGLHSSSILLGEKGPPLGGLSLHPLQTFADEVSGYCNLPGTPFSVEGSDELLPLGCALVEDLQGIAFPISAAQKPLYHAAACMASNYLVTLVATARQVIMACGFEQKEAMKLLGPLLKGTGKNLALLGPETALTGPIARGDTRTVAKHCKALEALPADVQEIYRVLGRKTVKIATAKGSLGPEGAREILEQLSKDD